MILENLTKEQLSKFCEKYNCSLSEFKPSYKGMYYLKMFTGAHGPQPEFYVTENSCVGINYYQSYDLTDAWLEFLEEVQTNQVSL